jgi:hypothetical protein
LHGRIKCLLCNKNKETAGIFRESGMASTTAAAAAAALV